MASKVDEYGNIHGSKLYERRARKVLPILVRQAKAAIPITYEDLAAEMDMPNPRNLNYPLGCIGTALRKLSEESKDEIPHIATLVVHKGDGAPGKGIDSVLKGLGKAWGSAKERRDVIRAYFLEITAYPYWDRVLAELGLEPTSAPIGAILEEAAGRGRGEGPEHKALKELVSRRPHLVGFFDRTGKTSTEHYLPSGDSIDVFFQASDSSYAVEVKPAGAPDHDIARGLFQCVKYRAVLQARAIFENDEREITTVLALGGKLPDALISLRNSLGVKVYESLAA